MKHTPGIVDVLRAQPERLALTKATPQTKYDGYPASWADHVTDTECRLQQPRLSAFPRRLGPLHGLRTHGIPGEPLVINGRLLQDAGQLGQDAAPLIDRGDGGLQLRHPRSWGISTMTSKAEMSMAAPPGTAQPEDPGPAPACVCDSTGRPRRAPRKSAGGRVRGFAGSRLKFRFAALLVQGDHRAGGGAEDGPPRVDHRRGVSAGQWAY